MGQGKSTSRISDPILVDNTPPIVGDLKRKIAGGSVKVSLTAADHTGTVAAVEYAVDSGQDWQLANASDKMFDSPLAPATFKGRWPIARPAPNHGASHRFPRKSRVRNRFGHDRTCKIVWPAVI